jgi:DNA-binding response OmpR family regulator
VKILLADSDVLTSGAIRRLLESAGHTVDLARTGEEAARALALRPQVLILDLALRGRAPLELLRAIRTAERCEHLYVLVTSSRGGTAELASAFAAGADDFAKKPIVREEILARIDGALRLRAAVTKLSSPAEPFASLDVWSSFPRLVQEAISATMDVELSVRRIGLRPEREERLRASAPAALVSLSLPVGPSELRMAIVGLDVGLPTAGIPARSPIQKGRALRVVVDAATAAAAAIEHHALAEDVMFSNRRVRTATASELPAVFACAPLLRRFALEGEGQDHAVQLIVLAAVAASESACMLASNLREGMMVARDVRNASGAVLLPAGARVTHASATRIASAVGPAAFVEVSLDPALEEPPPQSYRRAAESEPEPEPEHDGHEREAA